MTDKTIVEVMARAICEVDGFDPDAGDLLIRTAKGRRPQWEGYAAHVDAALSALSERGYVVVPRIPTAQMQDAGAAEIFGGLPRTDARECWTAMLTAAEEE